MTDRGTGHMTVRGHDGVACRGGSTPAPAAGDAPNHDCVVAPDGRAAAATGRRCPRTQARPIR